MTEHIHPHRLPPEVLASLLQTVRRKQERGEMEAARAVLHALTAQQPDDPRIWLALATAAATRAEQQAALERVLELDPANQLAQRALERFAAIPSAPSIPAGAPSPASQPDHPIAPLPAPVEMLDAEVPTEDDAAREIRWPLYVVIGVAVAIVLLAALLLRPDTRTADTLANTPTLPSANIVDTPLVAGGPASAPGDTGAGAQPQMTSVIALPILGASGENVPTADAPAGEGVGSNIGVMPTAMLVPTAGVVASPVPVLAPGQVVALPPWSLSLLRPDYALVLEGAIGALQPRGRFVLALMAVSNDGSAPARIPDALFTIHDRQGNRYTPVPTASTIYLDTYGRGQRGELSLEEELPPGGGLVSVPIIFDVPLDARGLTLHIGDQAAGWPIGGAP
jgi:hypothetical protein